MTSCLSLINLFIDSSLTDEEEEIDLVAKRLGTGDWGLGTGDWGLEGTGNWEKNFYVFKS